MTELGVEPRWTPPPLDTAALLRRAHGLMPADAVPAVPALCMRLVRYARYFDPHIDEGPVDDWGVASYRRWLDRLARADSSAVYTTLATDPANLLLGAKALSDPTLRAQCIRAQLDLYERERIKLPRLNQTVLGSLLEPDDPQPVANMVAEPLSAADLVRDPSPASLAALGLLSQRNPIGTVVRPEVVAALALRSVWMRDLSGVGLTLFGATLLHIPLPDGLLPWIARIARDDGFFGMWELYADPHARANLLGTVNIYWGLSAAAGEREIPARSWPAFPDADGASDAQLQDAIRNAQQWLDLQEGAFALLPACQDEDHFDLTFKALVELALLCHVLTRPRHDGSMWSRWARRTAERLHPHIEWEGLIEAFRLHTSGTLGLAIYPLLESVTGRACRFTSQARQLLTDPFAEAQERTPMREMDYQFTRRLMGLPMTLTLPAQLSRTLLQAPFDPTLMDTDALYDLTHIAFYATQFGCVSWAPPEDVSAAWPREALESMTLARLLMEDADLGAELLLTQFYTCKIPSTTSTMRPKCLRLLLEAQTPDGSFPGPELANETSDEFSARYHTTLVAMAALAESLA